MKFLTVKPHIHALTIDGYLVAALVLWEYQSHTVLYPHLLDFRYSDAVNEWQTPIVERLIDDPRPFFLRDHCGKEELMPKDSDMTGI